MPKSAVAGIVDRRGGLRVVVTESWRLRFHLGKGEKLFVVPDFIVDEPVEWGLIPYVIRRVELYIDEWISTRNEPPALMDRCIRKYLKNPNRFKRS